MQVLVSSLNFVDITSVKRTWPLWIGPTSTGGASDSAEVRIHRKLTVLLPLHGHTIILYNLLL